MKEKLKAELTESLHLPKDLMFGAVIVTAPVIRKYMWKITKES